MGDTYGAWEVNLKDGSVRLVISKADSATQGEARRLFGSENIVDITLVGSDHRPKEVKYASVTVVECP